MLDSSRNIALACALSALAGYVDGIGFLHLGGLFVSFMSGNSTRMGVFLADAHWQGAAKAFGLIVLFVAGAAFGSLIVRGGGIVRQGISRQGISRQSWLLLAEAVLLAVAALAHAFGLQAAPIVAIVVAMGLENAMFQSDGGAGLGLTYVTGALVKVGQLCASALTGGPRWAWLPNLLLWAALVAGAVAGAFAYSQINLAAIWFAAATALLLAAVAAIWARRRP